MEELLRIGSTLAITGLLLRVRVLLLSYEPERRRKHHPRVVKLDLVPSTLSLESLAFERVRPRRNDLTQSPKQSPTAVCETRSLRSGFLAGLCWFRHNIPFGNITHRPQVFQVHRIDFAESAKGFREGDTFQCG